MSETNNAAANASASAGGYAFASGDVGRASTRFHAHANFNASSVNDGTGGSFSLGVGLATGRFVGSTRCVESVTSAPITTTSVDTRTNTYGDDTTITMTTTTTTETTTTTTTTRIEAFEALTATASDFEDMTSQFASPSQATFTFSGYASAALGGIAYTRILTMPVTTTTVVTDTKITKVTPKGATTTEKTKTTSKVARDPTTARTIPGSDWFPNNFVTGYATAQAFSDDTSTYTFEVVGEELITVRYDAQGAFDAPVSYQIEVLNDATNMLVGASDWLDANAEGDVAWSLGSPGVYSLIIAANSQIGAPDDLSGPAGADPGWTLGVFEMSASSVPELSTWGMMLIGLAALGSGAFRRVVAVAPGRWLGASSAP